MKDIDLNIISKEFEGYYTVALTDQYLVGAWPLDKDILVDENNRKKILELRVFNSQGEYKWMRSNIGTEFHYRMLFDSEVENRFECPVIEKQLLDVDSTRLNGKNIHTANGGSYKLPFEVTKSDTPCIIIKYYIPKYDEENFSTVHSYVQDWRLAGFSLDDREEAL